MKKLILLLAMAVILSIGLGGAASASSLGFGTMGEGSWQWGIPSPYGEQYTSGAVMGDGKWYYDRKVGVWNPPSYNTVGFIDYYGSMTYFVGDIQENNTYSLGLQVGTLHLNVPSQNYQVMLLAWNPTTGQNFAVDQVSGVTTVGGLSGLNLSWTADDYAGWKIAVNIQGWGGSQLNIANVALNESSPAHAPEPATMLLLGSGLVGLVGVRRRFFKK